MKQKDIALIVLIVIISGIISFVVSSTLIAPPENRQQKVEVVNPITAEFPEADEQYFNANSINPTKPITIGGNPNQSPFNTGN